MAGLIFPLQFKRQYAASLDEDLTFDTVVEMNNYLSSALRYAGQIVSCLETEGVIYVLNNALDEWKPVITNDQQDALWEKNGADIYRNSNVGIGIIPDGSAKLDILGVTRMEGDLLVTGNIFQQGEPFITEAEHLHTKDAFVRTRSDATTGLNIGEISGIEVFKYDGTNSLIFGTGSDGWFRIGETGNLQRIATIQDSPLNKFTKYNETTNKLETVDISSSFISDFNFLSLTDTPSSYTADKWLKINAGATDVEFVDFPEVSNYERWFLKAGDSENLRLPTEAEWREEKDSWTTYDTAGAFGSPLKLPVAGYRFSGDGLLYNVDSYGHYWSSTVDGTYSQLLEFYSSNAHIHSSYRASGFSVRLILDGEFTLAEYQSDYEGTTVTIDGETYGYCFSPATGIVDPLKGRIWLDRNLGASQVATSSTDSNSYGWLYQWGRPTDGHQVRTSSTTSTLSSSDTPGHGDFIIINAGLHDWRDPQNDDLWQNVEGSVAIESHDIVNIKGGENIVVSLEGKTLTISSSLVNNDTTYAFSTGIGANGTFTVNPSDSNEYTVAIKGLGTAAFNNIMSSEYSMDIRVLETKAFGLGKYITPGILDFSGDIFNSKGEPTIFNGFYASSGKSSSGVIVSTPDTTFTPSGASQPIGEKVAWSIEGTSSSIYAKIYSTYNGIWSKEEELYHSGNISSLFQSSNDDPDTDKGLKVGGFGLGFTGVTIDTSENTPLNNLAGKGTGFYRFSGTGTSDTPFGLGVTQYFSVIHQSWASPTSTHQQSYQLAVHATLANRIFLRNKGNTGQGGGWNDWVEFHHTGNHGSAIIVSSTEPSTAGRVNGDIWVES